jgi:hypothetical protein
MDIDTYAEHTINGFAIDTEPLLPYIYISHRSDSDGNTPLLSAALKGKCLFISTQ